MGPAPRGFRFELRHANLCNGDRLAAEAAVAGAVKKGLRALLKTALDFLTGLLKLDRLKDILRKVFDRVREKVRKLRNKVVEWLRTKVGGKARNGKPSSGSTSKTSCIVRRNDEWLYVSPPAKGLPPTLGCAFFEMTINGIVN